MKINLIQREEFDALLNAPAELLQKLESEAFIVRSYLSASDIDRLLATCQDLAKAQKASWHPCDDHCPDYHRIHDQYPGAYVKSRQHAYYFHAWNEHKNLLDQFSELYDLKAALAGVENGFSHYKHNVPSDGVVSRLLVHQYPRGGGGQELHTDPTSELAKVQTIIQASTPGTDYASGGFYMVHDKLGRINIDPLTRKGDLLLVSPGVKHGVADVDPDHTLDWENTDGRWIIMPIFIHSDVAEQTHEKPKKVDNHG